jgi:hypothetical protein
VQISNGDGPRFEMQATRRTQKHPEGEPWPGNYKWSRQYSRRLLKRFGTGTGAE